MGVFSEMPLGGGRETERRESKLLIETIAIDESKKYFQNLRKLSSFFSNATLVADFGSTNPPKRQQLKAS